MRTVEVRLPMMVGAADEISAGSAAVLFGSFLVVALLISAAMLFVFAYLTGWHTLARRFPWSSRAGTEMAGGVIIGPLGFNGPPLRIGLDAAGIVLHPMRPFDLAFGKVCIPWTQIVSARRRDYHFFTVLEVCYGSGNGAILGFLPSPAARSIAERIHTAAFVADSES
jgi:hypothetical protein